MHYLNLLRSGVMGIAVRLCTEVMIKHDPSKAIKRSVHPSLIPQKRSPKEPLDEPVSKNARPQHWRNKEQLHQVPSTPKASPTAAATTGKDTKKNKTGEEESVVAEEEEEVEEVDEATDEGEEEEEDLEVESSTQAF